MFKLNSQIQPQTNLELGVLPDQVRRPRPWRLGRGGVQAGRVQGVPIPLQASGVCTLVLADRGLPRGAGLNELRAKWADGVGGGRGGLQLA